jgi:hypothetical protein
MQQASRFVGTTDRVLLLTVSMLLKARGYPPKRFQRHASARSLILTHALLRQIRERSGAA